MAYTAKPLPHGRILTEGEEMSSTRKSTDPGLSNAERKILRATEAQEAMSDHDDAQKAFNENRERLRQARLERETEAGPMLYPASELPDRAGSANLNRPISGVSA